jgi:hypothetical protein
MRRCRAAVTVLTVVLMSLLMAGPASAGGPTSVLMVEQETGTSSALVYSDPDYETLATLVGANQGALVRGTEDRSGATHDSGSGITLTWMLHDVTVWRVDRIFLDAKGGPWIASQSSIDGSSVWDSPVVWHAVSDGAPLTTLLKRAGFGAGATAGADSDGAAVPTGNGSVQPVQPVTPTQPWQQLSQPTASTPAWAWWAWGLVGLALGAALAATAAVLVARTRRPANGPATAHLTDAEMSASQADQTEPDEGSTWTAADELSWSGSPRG